MKWNNDAWDYAGTLGIAERQRSGFLAWVSQLMRRTGCTWEDDIKPTLEMRRKAIGPFHPAKYYCNWTDDGSVRFRRDLGQMRAQQVPRKEAATQLRAIFSQLGAR